MKQLKIYQSLGQENSVGWDRDETIGNLHLVHVFAQALPGAVFQPSDGRGGPHWPCAVCERHGYTEADFHRQMTELMGTASA